MRPAGSCTLLTAGARAALARWRVHRQIQPGGGQGRPRTSRSGTRATHSASPEVARLYADRRLDAGRRVAEYRLYARLFSLWHVLHIPLFFMLLIAGIVHVIAVNVY